MTIFLNSCDFDLVVLDGHMHHKFERASWDEKVKEAHSLNAKVKMHYFVNFMKPTTLVCLGAFWFKRFGNFFE